MTRNNSKDKNSNFVQRFEEIADLENNIDTCRRKIIDNKIFPVNIKHFNIVSRYSFPTHFINHKQSL